MSSLFCKTIRRTISWVGLIFYLPLALLNGCSGEKPEKVINLDGRKHQVVKAIALHPDGATILVNTRQWIGFYNLSDLQLTGEIKPTATEPIGEWLTFSQDGKSLITGSSSLPEAEWDLATKKHIPREITPERIELVRSLREIRQVSPDKKFKLVVKEITSPQLPRLVEVRSNDANAKLLFVLEHKDFVNDAVFSPDGKWIATGSGSTVGFPVGRFQIWDATTGKLFKTMERSYDVGTLAFTRDSKSLLVGTRFDIELWSIDTILGN